MNWWSGQRVCLVALVALSQPVLRLSLFAQTNDPGVSVTVAGTDGSKDQLPPCPVELFRELLAKDRAAQEQLLVAHNLEDRKLIFAKVREYRALKPEQRELRLKATELRWYLRRLMDIPAADRPALLARVPERDRKLVQARLDYWDKLPIASKDEFRTNEAAVTYLTMPVEQRTIYYPTNISPARRMFLVDGIDHWQAMPEAQRQKLLQRFSQMFQFKPEEQQKIVAPLSEAERQQIEKTLKKFAELPPADRLACIQSFEKFTTLSVEERQQFLKNVEHWKLMTPAERQQWRDLVEDLSQLPPMPAELELPPMPPGFNSPPALSR